MNPDPERAPLLPPRNVRDAEDGLRTEPQNAGGKLFKFLQVYFLFFLLIPIFPMSRSRHCNLVLAITGIAISILYQAWNAYHVTSRTDHFIPIEPVNLTINRTEIIVLSEQVKEISKEIVWIWYISVRFLMVCVFWYRRHDVANIFTIIGSNVHSENEINDNETRKLEEWSILLIICTICLIAAEIICCAVAFIDVGPRLCWQCLASSIYSGTVIMSLLMIYYFSVCGLESMFIVLFEPHQRPFDPNQELRRNQVVQFQNKLDSISRLISKIEQTLGFFIFWIFTLNFAEFSFAVIVIPEFEHFSLGNEDDMTWFLKMFKNGIILGLLTIVIMKVDQVRRTANNMFAHFKQIANQNVTTDIQCLMSNAEQVVRCNLTAWVGCFELRRAIILTYLTTIIIFCNLAFSLIRKINK